MSGRSVLFPTLANRCIYGCHHNMGSILMVVTTINKTTINNINIDITFNTLPAEV